MSEAPVPNWQLWGGILILALAAAATCAQPVEPDQLDLDARRLANPTVSLGIPGTVTPDVPTSTIWPEQRR